MSESATATDHLYTQEISEGWQFRQLGTEKWYPAKVPGNIYTDLFANGLIEDPLLYQQPEKLDWVEKTDWEYRTIFVYKDEYMKYDVVDLVFEGLDTYAEVFLNEKSIKFEGDRSPDNMHQIWRVDVKDKIIPDDFELVFKVEETNELRIIFRSAVKLSIEDYKVQGCILPASEAEPAPRLSVYNRKASYHFGSDFTPRLAGCGVWKKVYLCAWSKARIDNIHFTLRELENKYASLTAKFEVVAAKKVHALFRIKSKDDGFSAVMEPASLEEGWNTVELNFEILHPRLWWPHSMGNPSRYEIRGEMTIDTRVAQFQEHKIGLRKIELVDDKRGAGALLKINGTPLFIKGANWLPPDYFPHRKSKDDYRKILQDAIESNINMLRIWGGGIYERNEFYELCDELGIMVWHEFMFGTGLYPASIKMQDRIKQEVEDQLRRLRNYACLALWSGNESTEMIWKTGVWQERYDYSPSIRDKTWSDYQKIFYDLIPHLMAKYDEGRLYIPSYPQVEESDQHFIQLEGFPGSPSYPAWASYFDKASLKLESDEMSFHQVKKFKSASHDTAHHLIAHEMKGAYPTCPDVETWTYLSQVLQADKMKAKIEEVRRSRPNTMGVFYGRLHDNWLATSDASIDYKGKWKALHYKLRHAFADILISPKLVGKAEAEMVAITIVSDKMKKIQATLQVDLMDFKGNIIQTENKEITVLPYSSEGFFDLEVPKWLETKSRNNHFLRIILLENSQVISQSLFYFVQPNTLNLEKPQLSSTFIHTNETYKIELISDTLMKDVYLSLKSARGFFSDNFFDLLPNKPYSLFLSPVGPELNLGQEMEITSMVDLM